MDSISTGLTSFCEEQVIFDSKAGLTVWSTILGGQTTEQITKTLNWVAAIGCEVTSVGASTESFCVMQNLSTIKAKKLPISGASAPEPTSFAPFGIMPPLAYASLKEVACAECIGSQLKTVEGLDQETLLVKTINPTVKELKTTREKECPVLAVSNKTEKEDKKDKDRTPSAGIRIVTISSWRVFIAIMVLPSFFLMC